MGPIRVNSGRMVHETIDGETIVIDLETGIYYSLRGSAMLLWPALSGGTDTASLTAAAVDAWSTDPAATGSAIEVLVSGLLAAEVLVTAAETVPAEVGALDGPYAPPEFVVHSNMDDLLLLDPIHDVDEQGWPQQRPA